MTELVKQTLLGQYEAALTMLKLRVEACPDEYWETPVGEGTIRQDAYHVLFWTNYYLLDSEDAFVPNEYIERGGDEFQPTISEGLTKTDTLAFIDFTHQHIIDSLRNTSEASIQEICFPTVFRRKPFTRLELHLYNMRHLQHHTAQMSLAIRKVSDANGLGLKLPWVGSGWR